MAAAVERLTRVLRGRQLDQRRRELLLEATALARRLEEHRDRLARRRQRGALPCREQDAELHAGVEEIATELARLLA